MLTPQFIAFVAGLRGVRRIIRCCIVLSSPIAFTAASPALAASGTWSVSAATPGAWQTTTNWVGGIVPGATSGITNTDTATFNSSSSFTSVVPDLGRNLENITFDTLAAAYTIGTSGGNALVMRSFGTIQIASTFSGSSINETINAPLTLEGDCTLADNSANAGVSLDFGGAISAADQGGSVLTVAGAGNTTISGAFGGIKTIDLVKSGAGTLTLSGNNTFTGGVTINVGLIILGNPGALNSTSPNAVTFGSGSTGDLALVRQSVTISALSSNGGTPVVENGSNVTAVTLSVNNAIANTYGGVLEDGGTASLALSKSGAGTLLLTGANTYTGGTTISGGTLQLGDGMTNNGSVTGNITDNAALAFANPNAQSYAGVVDGTGSLTKSGVGTLNLGDSNNDFHGGLTIQNGTLQVDFINNANSSGPLGNIPIVTLGSSGQTGTLEVLEPVDLPVSSMLFNLASGGAGVIQIDSSALTLTGIINGSGALTKSGQGILVLSGNNGFTGGLTVQGVLEVPTVNNAGTNGPLGNNTSVTLGSVGNLPGVVVYTGSSDASSDMPFSLVGPGGQLETDSANLTLSGVISGSGALTVSPSNFTLTLSGNNTFTGGTTIVGRALQLGSAGALQNSTVTVPATNDLAFSPGIGTFNIGGLSGAGGFALNDTSAGNVTISVGANGASTTYSGVLSGGGGLVKVGTGTLTLAGANTYAGGTTVTAGALNTDSSGTLGPDSLTISAANGITSAVDLGNSQTVSALSGTVSGTGSARVNVGAGTTLTVNQSVDTTFAGAIALAAGATAGTGAALTKSNGGTLEIDGGLSLGNDSSLAVGGGKLRLSIISGSASVGSGVTANVTGSGVLELAGSVSSLGTTIPANRVAITNSSNAVAGLLVSAGSQQLGGIGGSGNTQVNAGASLIADHIVQSALIIGGAPGSPALVTIDASDASGNPLFSSLAGSLAPSDSLGASGGFGDSSGDAFGSERNSTELGGSGQTGGRAAIPEPSSAILLAVGGLAAVRTILWGSKCLNCKNRRPPRAFNQG